MGGEVVKNPDSDSLLDMMAMKGEVVDIIDESQELLTNADSMSSDEKPPRLTEQSDEDSSSSSDELNSGYKLVMDIIIEEVLENEDEWCRLMFYNLKISEITFIFIYLFIEI